MARFVMIALIFGMLIMDGVRPTIPYIFNPGRPTILLAINA